MSGRITLYSSDGNAVEAPAHVVNKMSPVIKLQYEQTKDTDRKIVLDINSKILGYVVEWCNFMFDFIDLDKYDVKTSHFKLMFWQELGVDEKVATLEAADKLGITPMVEQGCEIIASMIKGKSTKQLRSLFGITNDFLPEEEEQMEQEFGNVLLGYDTV